MAEFDFTDATGQAARVHSGQDGAAMLIDVHSSQWLRLRGAPRLIQTDGKLERAEGSEMRKVIVNEWMSLDGVVQAPGAAEEDTTGGFAWGGWHLRYFDDISRRWVVENLTGAGGFVLGRRTYESFAAHWPNASEEEQAVAEPLNSLPKYVATTTLTDPLEWQHSTVLHGDVADAVLALKQEVGDDLHVIGSTELVKTLIERELVDEFRVMIDPVVLGGGKRVFQDDGALRPLRLVDSQVTTTGAILATYAPAEA